MALAEKNSSETKFKDALTCLDNAEKIADKVSGGVAKIDALRKKVKTALGEGSMFGASTEDKSDGKNVKLGNATKVNTPKAETDDEGNEDE